MDEHPLTSDHVPSEWTPAVAAASICTCPVPLPQVRATWKGAAHTQCGRCGLPGRIDFDRR